MNDDVGNLTVVIPAYNPTSSLVEFIHQLRAYGIKNIVVVNDGSRACSIKIFDDLRHMCIVLDHTINKGKGCALKTAFEYCVHQFPNAIGIVSADADGQHSCKDILKVGKSLRMGQNKLILGARKFGQNVPFRSKFGNLITRKIFSLLTGHTISDTQTGLRGIPFNRLSQFILLDGKQYEYEMNMLLAATRLGITIEEVPIQTIYLDNNATSHFRPLKDSLKIYFLMLKFILNKNIG